MERLVLVITLTALVIWVISVESRLASLAG